MKKIILIHLLFLFTIEIYTQPKINYNSDIISKIDTVTPILYEKTIGIYNKGNRELIINSIGVSCGCTTHKISKDTIFPNDSAILNLKIDIRTASGNRIYRAIIYSNDSINPKLDIPLNLFVYRDVIATPTKLPMYSNVSANYVLTYNITLNNLSNEELQIQSPIIEDSTKFEIVSINPLDKVIPKNSSREYEIKVLPKRKNSIISKMYIPTNSKIVPKIEYTLMVKTN